MGCYPQGINKVIKKEREARHEISCGRCRYHRGENARKHPRPDRYKNHRKNHRIKEVWTMPVIVEKADWKEWLDDPEEHDRTWTYYQCPCGHEVMSDIAYHRLICPKCGSTMPKKEAKS
jgi:DNA-directed RNA polymerase subunit RPC12/RpoP